MKKLYTITLLLLVLFMSTAAFAQYELLYVNKDNIKADSILMEYLTASGYNITFVSNAEFKTVDGVYSTADSYYDFDALYIGEALGSGDLFNFHVAGYPIPCVTTEGWAFKTASTKWNWLDNEAVQFHQLGGADGATAEQTNTIVFMGDEETWLGRQYEYGYEMIWTLNEGVTAGSNGVALDEVIYDAIPIGNLSADSLKGKPIFWAIPEGSTVTTDPNGNPVDYDLPAMVYLGTIGGGQDNPTPEYLELILNCILWVTGNYEVVGIDDVVSRNVSVYPNPSNGIVNFSFKSPVSGNLNVYNLAGALVKTKVISTPVSNMNLDLSKLGRGQYLYSMTTKNEILRGKILKN